MTAFLLRTPRLLLRHLTPDDAQAMFDLNSDPEVLRFTVDPPPVSLEAVRQSLVDYAKVYQADGFARWAAIEEATGAWIGWCGLRKQADGGVNVGYRLRRASWGRGFATEGARASLAYGFEERELARITGVAHLGNAASIRVLGKIGMRFEKKTTEDGAAVEVWAQSRAEWDAGRRRQG